MDFTFADENVVAAEDLSIGELASGISEKETIANDSASRPEGDAGDAPQPVTSKAAVAVVDMLRMYQSSEAGVWSHFEIIEATLLKHVLAKLCRVPSTTFLRFN